MTLRPLQPLRRIKRAVCAGAAALLLAGPASATWSIVVLNRDTGEVAVATSTCIANSDISFLVPVVRVGVAAGASQSFVDPIGRNKRRIWNHSRREGATPAALLNFISTVDGGFQQRQFGIVSFKGPPVTFSGNQNFDVALGVTGQVGPYDYAIQGNILTGENVVFDCETAFLTEQGDLGQKMMAAMEAARDAGGDGRCSCSGGLPTSCGSPPPSFSYASYNAFMVIARLGDTDNTLCNNNVSCVNGDYYLKLNYVGDEQSQEPIAALRDLYSSWRASQLGRPDHILSEAQAAMPRLRADGATRSRIRLALKDVDGVPLGAGGHAVSLTRRSGDDGLFTVQSVEDYGDGTYAIELLSTLATGAGEFAVVVDDGVRPVELYPSLSITSAAPSELHLGFDEVSASQGAQLPILVDLGVGAQGTSYRVLGSLSGTSPQATFGGVSVPLASDRFFELTASWAGAEPFIGNAGVLDTGGQASAQLEIRPGALAALAGSTMHFAVWTPGSVTAAQGVQIIP